MTDDKTGKRPKYQKPEIIDFEYDATDYAVGRGSCKPGAGANGSCGPGAGARAACNSGAGAGSVCNQGSGPTSG